MNFSHGTAAEHEARVESRAIDCTQGRPRGRRARRSAGPEDPHRQVRPRASITLNAGRQVRARRRARAGRRRTASGSITRTCRTTCTPAIRCCSTTGGIVLGVDRGRRLAHQHARRAGRRAVNNKGINRKGGGLTAPALTDKDMRGHQDRGAAQGGLSGGVVSRARAPTSTGRASSCTQAGGNSLVCRQDRARRGDRRAGGDPRRVRRASWSRAAISRWKSAMP